MNTIVKIICASLATFTGAPLERSNVGTGRGTITSWENEQVQVRETKPTGGQLPGVRVSVQGDHLRTLATTDGGFAKLQFQLDLKTAIEARLPAGWTLSFSDAPGRNGGNGYPVIYVNRETAETKADSGTNTQNLVTEALEAGVDQADVLAALRSGNFDGLRGMIALASATVAPAETQVDNDGDGFPA